MQSKIVQKFGNSGHIVLPKEYIGKRIRFVAEPKTFEDIKLEILEILNPYLENILGIYLYGSFARNEQTIDSDVDILVITNTKLRILDKIDDYSIVSVTIDEIKKTLEHNAVLILPIVKEAKTVINPDLLENYKKYKFTRRNTKYFTDSSTKILGLNKKGSKLDIEIGSIVYSLMLRIRGLLMIKLILNNKSYLKSSLFRFLENNYMPRDKVEELYKIYSDERNNIKIRESDLINKEDIKKLVTIAEKLLKEIKVLLK